MSTRNTPLPRFFGGHYDTVKQSRVLTLLERENTSSPSLDLRDWYTARMRLDILLCGNIVLTDTMYYDGIFFQNLIQDPSFFQFLNNLNQNAPHIEIRIRPKGLAGIVGKGIYLSSLEGTSQVREEVSQTMRETSRLHSGDFENASQALKAFYEACDPSQKPAFQKMSETMLELEAKTPRHIYRPWEVDWIQCLNSAKTELPYTIPESEDPAVNFTLREMKDEYDGKFDRTRLRHIALREDDPDTTVDDPIIQGWAHMLKVYNLALAKQHQCNMLDVGEDLVYTYTQPPADFQPEEFDDVKEYILKGLSPSIIEAIAKEDWNDFLKRLQTGPIRQPFEGWRIGLIEAQGMPDGLARNVFLYGKILPLVHAILRSYEQYPSISLAGPMLGVLGAGALPDKFKVAGIVLGTISLAAETGKATASIIKKKTWKNYNLVKIGLSSANAGINR